MSRGKRSSLLTLLLYWQGIYYGVTGIWALVALGSFSRLTGDSGDPFDMRSISALALVLGIAFIRGAMLEKYLVFAGWLLLGSALAVIIPELIYFDEIWGTLFLADLLEEVCVAIATIFTLRQLTTIPS